MAYSYDDFTAAAKRAGLLGEFSQADLDTARRDPQFGMSILGYKQDIHRATTPEAKQLAHQAAEELRKSYGNYSGGASGGQYKSAGKIPGQIDTVLDRIAGFEPAENPYQDRYQEALDALGSFGDFSYEAAPEYENRYQDQQKALLDAIVNREDFSWSKETDPLWPVYRKEYLREGERASADALGKAAAATGGRPSTAAVTAASQAGDYYAAKLNDMIPALYQQAYDKYLKEYQMKLSDLSAVNSQEQLDYQKYLNDLGQYNTDRGFSYQQYLDDYTRQLQNLDALESAQRLGMDRDASDFAILQGKLGSLQSQDQSDYGRYLDQLTRQDQREQAQRQEQLSREQERRELLRGQVDAILAAGGTPTAEMVSGSGYDQTYVDALRGAWLREQQAAQTARRSSGGSGRSSSSSGGSSSGSGGGSQDYEGLFAKARESGHAKSYIANNYKKFGFSSSSGLYDDFKEWDEGQDEGAEGGGTASSPRTSFYYDPNEGGITWNGQTFYVTEKFIDALEDANLTKAEQSELRRKAAAFGIDLEF